MADTLYRYDESTATWVPVTDVSRIDVTSGGGLEFIDYTDFYSTDMDVPG